MTTLHGDYEPSAFQWVRDQVAEYEASGGQRANTLLDTGMPIVVVTSRGAKTGKVRKNPLMRVEHDGEYALVASKGGTPENPEWYHNLVAHPDEVLVQDGPEPFTVRIREISGDEKAEWWERAVAAYPPYAEYQEKTDRPIPVFVATPVAADQPAGSKASTIAARQGGSSASRSSGVLPRRTTTRSRAGETVIVWPS